MLTKGAAKKVTIYVNEDAKHHLSPLYESILLFLLHKGVAGATATRAYSQTSGSLNQWVRRPVPWSLRSSRVTSGTPDIDRRKSRARVALSPCAPPPLSAAA